MTPLEELIHKIVGDKLAASGLMKVSDFTLKFHEQPLVSDFKDHVLAHVKEWQDQQSRQEHRSTENVALKAESTAIKAEATAVNVAANFAKVEANVFTLQADGFRVDAVLRDFVTNVMADRAAVKSLKEQIATSSLSLAKLREFSEMSKRDTLELLQPEKLRLDIEALDVDVTHLEHEVRQLKAGRGPAGGPVGGPPGAPRVGEGSRSWGPLPPTQAEMRTLRAEAEKVEKANKELAAALTATYPENVRLLREIQRTSDALK